jgi:hypothetical protein
MVDGIDFINKINKLAFRTKDGRFKAILYSLILPCVTYKIHIGKYLTVADFIKDILWLCVRLFILLPHITYIAMQELYCALNLKKFIVDPVVDFEKEEPNIQDIYR